MAHMKKVLYNYKMLVLNPLYKRRSGVFISNVIVISHLALSIGWTCEPVPRVPHGIRIRGNGLSIVIKRRFELNNPVRRSVLVVRGEVAFVQPLISICSSRDLFFIFSVFLSFKSTLPVNLFYLNKLSSSFHLSSFHQISSFLTVHQDNVAEWSKAIDLNSHYLFPSGSAGSNPAVVVLLSRQTIVLHQAKGP